MTWTREDQAASRRRSYQRHAERRKAASRAWRVANRDHVREYNRTYRLGIRPEKKRAHARQDNARNGLRRRLQARYRLSIAQQQALFDAQGGRCGICGTELVLRSRNTHLDHDHQTDQIRGFLCGLCNRGIGALHDDVALLRSAIAWLEAA